MVKWWPLFLGVFLFTNSVAEETVQSLIDELVNLEVEPETKAEVEVEAKAAAAEKREEAEAKVKAEAEKAKAEAEAEVAEKAEIEAEAEEDALQCAQGYVSEADDAVSDPFKIALKLAEICVTPLVKLRMLKYKAAPVDGDYKYISTYRGENLFLPVVVGYRASIAETLQSDQQDESSVVDKAEAVFDAVVEAIADEGKAQPQAGTAVESDGEREPGPEVEESAAPLTESNP